MPRGHKRTKAQYRALLAEQQRSELSLPEFAVEKGVPYSTLAMWRRRLEDGDDSRRRGQAPRGPSRARRSRRSGRKSKRREPEEEQRPADANGDGVAELLPVRLALSGSDPEPARAGQALPFELVLRSGEVVRVPAGFDRQQLRALLEVVEGARC